MAIEDVLEGATFGRREFLKSTPVVLGGLGVLAQASFAENVSNPSALTVGDVIGVVLKRFAVEPVEDTVDTIKAGNTSLPVRGIVTTFMATVPVIKQAIDLDADFIITHEPTFYSHFDDTDWLDQDRVYQHKRRLLDSHGITVWRYHDYIHRITPDPIIAGLIDRLGWAEYVDQDEQRICSIPQTRFADLAQHCQQKLGTNTVRTVGAPDLACTRVGVLPGAPGGRAQIGFLGKHPVDAVICGEIAEWETCEYVRDSQHTVKPVGLIVTGHQPSEEDGMRWLADQLKTQFPGIPVSHIPAGSPFE